MQIKIIDFKGGATQERVRQFEQKLQASLPLDYGQFLLLYNGGRPHPDIFEYKLQDGRVFGSSVKIFLGFDQERHSDLEFHQRLFSERVPLGLTPIAKDSCGNLILISLLRENFGSVYFWDHEEEAEDGEPPTYDNLYFIADSFTNFLNCLRPLNDEEIAYIEKQAATAEVK